MLIINIAPPITLPFHPYQLFHAMAKLIWMSLLFHAYLPGFFLRCNKKPALLRLSGIFKRIFALMYQILITGLFTDVILTFIPTSPTLITFNHVKHTAQRPNINIKLNLYRYSEGDFNALQHSYW